MNRNRLLYWALTGSKLVGVSFGIALSVFIGLFIHWHITPESYKSVQVIVACGSITLSEEGALRSKPGLGNGNINLEIGRTRLTSDKRFYLNDLNAVSIYFTFFQLVLSIVLGLLVVREVIRILKSVQDLQTFNSSNVKSFRFLGYLYLAMAALTSIHIVGTNQDSIKGFNLDFDLLALMLAAFIMAEIFKEGHNLSEQDKLTI